MPDVLITPSSGNIRFSQNINDNAASVALSGNSLVLSSTSGNISISSSSGLLINGVAVSTSGHTHTSANITDFNSSVSGLLPKISNSGDNRILTSTGSSTGINAETNATFDGTNFNVSGVLNVDNLRLDGNTISSINTNGDLILSTNGAGRASVGANNLASASNSFVNGTNNVAAGKVRRANNITSSTSTITVLGATAADFDNTTDNALQIRYFFNNTWNLITRTVSTAVQGTGGNSANVTVTVTSNVGTTSQTWSEVTVVNTAGTESMIGGTVGGTSNIASENNSTVAGGLSNNASGTNSTVAGGQNNTASGAYSCVLGGVRAVSSKHGEVSHAAGRFVSDGDAQHSILVARRETTNATANQVLFLNGSSERLTIPAETTWTFSIKLSAYNDTDNQGGWWIFRGGIRRNQSNGTALVGSIITENGVESTLSAASASVVADDTNEALEIRVTGVASKTIRWVAVVDISQVSSSVSTLSGLGLAGVAVLKAEVIP